MEVEKTLFQIDGEKATELFDEHKRTHEGEFIAVVSSGSYPRNCMTIFRILDTDPRGQELVDEIYKKLHLSPGDVIIS